MMTRNEVDKILDEINSTYPERFRNYTTKQMEKTAIFWQRLFQDFTFEQVYAGLIAFIRQENKGYAPTPGQIIDRIVSLSVVIKGEEDFAHACDQLIIAISDGYYHAQERFDALPEICKKFVRTPNQLRIWSGAFNMKDVIRDFTEFYSKQIGKSIEELKLPTSIKSKLALLTEAEE